MIERHSQIGERRLRHHAGAYRVELDIALAEQQIGLGLVSGKEHRAGEKLFVDYAGQCAEVVDRRTGEIRQAQIFVAVLGASNYTYAEATWTQQLPDWIGTHVRAFAFFGGTSKLLVPDNLRSGVTKAHRYEPDLNPTYAELVWSSSTTQASMWQGQSRRIRRTAWRNASICLTSRSDPRSSRLIVKK